MADTPDNRPLEFVASTPDAVAAARVAAYRPVSVDAEWSPADRARLRGELLADTAPGGRIRFRPRRRFAVPAAAAVVVALIGGVVITAVRSERDSGSGLRTAGSPLNPGDPTSTPVAGHGQYSYRVDIAYSIGADGRRKPHPERNEHWVSPDGSIRTVIAVNGKSECDHLPFAGEPNFEDPTKAFFDELPTDPDKLKDYLRSHVDGSSSTEEAVFVAVGDMLRNADGLATSKLRAALVAALSRTDGVTIHRNVVDDLRGRRAVRADFVDQRKRPGEIQSLFFDARTFQLLEERHGSTDNGAAPTLGPSPAYTKPPATGATTLLLTGPASIDAMTTEKVVDSLPPRATQACHADH